jgi:hypothetical protein
MGNAGYYGEGSCGTSAGSDPERAQYAHDARVAARQACVDHYTHNPTQVGRYWHYCTGCGEQFQKEGK